MAPNVLPPAGPPTQGQGQTSSFFQGGRLSVCRNRSEVHALHRLHPVKWAGRRMSTTPVCELPLGPPFPAGQPHLGDARAGPPDGCFLPADSCSSRLLGKRSFYSICNSILRPGSWSFKIKEIKSLHFPQSPLFWLNEISNVTENVRRC